MAEEQVAEDAEQLEQMIACRGDKEHTSTMLNENLASNMLTILFISEHCARNLFISASNVLAVLLSASNMLAFPCEQYARTWLLSSASGMLA